MFKRYSGSASRGCAGAASVDHGRGDRKERRLSHAGTARTRSQPDARRRSSPRRADGETLRVIAQRYRVGILATGHGQRDIDPDHVCRRSLRIPGRPRPRTAATHAQLATLPATPARRSPSSAPAVGDGHDPALVSGFASSPVEQT